RRVLFGHSLDSPHERTPIISSPAGENHGGRPPRPPFPVPALRRFRRPPDVLVERYLLLSASRASSHASTLGSLPPCFLYSRRSSIALPTNPWRSPWRIAR